MTNQIDRAELLKLERLEMRAAIDSVGERRLNTIDRTINLVIGATLLLATFGLVWAAPYLLGGHLR